MESQTIELGAATLVALQALVPPVGMTPLAWGALGGGLGQLVLLTVGLMLMSRSNTSREQQTQALALASAQRHAETLRAFEQQATASREQHAATMRALEALIERTAPSQA